MVLLFFNSVFLLYSLVVFFIPFLFCWQHCEPFVFTCLHVVHFFLFLSFSPVFSRPVFLSLFNSLQLVLFPLILFTTCLHPPLFCWNAPHLKLCVLWERQSCTRSIKPFWIVFASASLWVSLCMHWMFLWTIILNLFIVNLLNHLNMSTLLYYLYLLISWNNKSPAKWVFICVTNGLCHVVCSNCLLSTC